MRAEQITSIVLRVGFWLPLALCTYLAFVPSPPEPIFRVSDVLLHGMAFAYLTFALGVAYRFRRGWWTAAWMVAYGLFIEAVQSFEPQRSAELKDLIVDCVGIGLGLMGLWGLGESVRATALQLARHLVRSR